MTPDTDRELLELTAKAIGLPEPDGWHHHAGAVWLKSADGVHRGTRWNPLADDGDALRLAVKLGIAVVPYPIYAKPKHSVIAKQYNQASYLRGEGQDVNIEEVQVYRDSPEAATRRAIVRAAAAMAPKSDARDPGVQS